MTPRYVPWLLAPLVLITCKQTIDVGGGGGAGTTPTTSSTGSTTGTGGGSCVDVSGAFVVDATATCTSFLRPPAGACILQEGCHIEIALDTGTLAGTVSGDSLTASGPVVVDGATVQVACTGTVQGAMASLACTAAGVACSLPATRQPLVAGVQSYCCDPLHPTCSAGAHCTWTVPDVTSGEWFTSCVTASGTGHAGDTCTSTDVGFDDCADGLFCAFYGHAGNDYRCLRFCEKAGDCSPTETCLGGGGVRSAGECVSTCTVFGTDCGAGTSCHPFWALDAAGALRDGVGSFCSPVGHGAVGIDCVANSQCLANDVCGLSNKCAPMCDQGHPCATGTCTPMGYVAPNQGVGYCKP